MGKAMRWGGLLLFAAAVNGQDLPPDEPFNERRHAAAGYAIGMDLITHALARSCAVYGGEALERTRAGRQAWQRRNQDWVDASHRYLRVLEAAIAADEGEEAGRRFYEQRKDELQAESQALLERSFPPDADAFDTCRGIAEDFERGTFDLGQHPDHGATLRALLLDLPPPSPAR